MNTLRINHIYIYTSCSITETNPVRFPINIDRGIWTGLVSLMVHCTGIKNINLYHKNGGLNFRIIYKVKVDIFTNVKKHYL